VVRRLQQQVARTGEGRHAAAADRAGQIGVEVHVGALDQAQADAGGIEFGLQRGDRRADAGRVVVVHARVDVRRARDRADAVRVGDARHLQRRRQVGRAVVDAGQKVAMQVEHAHP